MSIQDILNEYVKRHNITGREFARRCGEDISYPYVANILRGYSPSTGEPPKVSGKKLEAIARGMNITVDQLNAMLNTQPAIMQETRPSALHPMPYTPARSMVPIVGAVRCGAGGGLWFEDLQGSEVADVADPSEYFYLRADGDSMEPRIFEGDLILIHAQPEIESGEVGVIVVDQEDGLLKKYIERDDAVILQSYNPNYLPRIFVGKEKARLQVIGKAVQLLRRGI